MRYAQNAEGSVVRLVAGELDGAVAEHVLEDDAHVAR